MKKNKVLRIAACLYILIVAGFRRRGVGDAAADLFLQGSAEYDGSVADEAGAGSGCRSSPEFVDFPESLRCDHTAAGIGLLFSLYLRTSYPFYYVFLRSVLKKRSCLFILLEKMWKTNGKHRKRAVLNSCPQQFNYTPKKF